MESKTEKKAVPAAKSAPKPVNKSVVTISPDGREYVTSRAEAERLNRTAGYKIKS